MFHFDPKKYFSCVGVFWHPENPDKRFPGVLDYAPDNGLSLKTITEVDFSRIAQKTIQDKTIHGFVEDIEEITLLNCLPNGKNSDRFGKASYSIKSYVPLLAILGRHCDKSDKVFTGITFHFPEMDFFCVPNPDSYFVSDKREIINCRVSEDQYIKIHQGRRDPINLNGVFPENRKGRNESVITKAFFCVTITGNTGTIAEYIREQSNTLHMFSAFLLRAVCSDFMEIHENEKSYTAIMQHSVKNNYANSNFLMPHMTMGNIKSDFVEIFKKWNDMPREIHRFIIDKFYNNARPGYQQYSIIIAALASWQMTKGIGKKKYEDLLKENLPIGDPISDEILENLREILENTKTLEGIAADLGKIRDCILHMDCMKNSGTYKKYSAVFEDETKMKNLCEILFIFMIKIVYSHIGIVLSDNQKERLAEKIMLQTHYSL